MSNIKPPTRNQLATFLKTPELIRTFERMANQSLELLPEDVAAINARIDQSDIGYQSALSSASEALGLIESIEKSLSIIASQPMAFPQIEQDAILPAYCLGTLSSQNDDRVTLTDWLYAPKTITPAGTTGARTINKIAGSVNFAAAATSLVVTNSKVDSNSIILCTVATNDTTMKSVSAVSGSGSFTLYANAAPTAETKVNFFVIN